MTDYGHDLLFGLFVTPDATNARHVLELAETADRAGLDLVTFQDHPYQPAFFDTWTLLSYAAARTEKVRLAGNVLNLPLRPPAMLAKAAASLDILSGGRFELGIGAGGFWDGIAAMGGRRLTPGQSIDALREAIEIIRDLWDTDAARAVRHDGRYYQAVGVRRGPRPAHDIGIWIGAYKPRILELVGAVGDGWLPTLDFLLRRGGSPLDESNARIDEAAEAAGRSPAAVRRLVNIMRPEFSPVSRGLLTGPPRQWVEQLAGLALDHGISGFIIGGDDPATAERFAAEVAPAVRELVAAERGKKSA